ncbi:carboxy terminal-processing peptidase [Desulforhopalus singaporensis]|uniref:C-terminal processing peptidase-1. Serine peptidase. MEROPS family S41A n=1 Tax=Desulforhopalus singaporensis TaxID=91360 RepID=A0A1H0NBZ1_9BACT|nr:carboxy terminal-processing peptidase [Desulforhopalus singaporensis]SDO90171.1 C-terminal processing peptidase-1. Serine peptidase. MEROPS family S41A [Desulforhopalus singaporensis]
MNFSNKKLFFLPLLLCLFLVPPSFGQTGYGQKFDRKRNRLIGYILSQQLPALHYSAKALDDELSQAAFHLYINQLDYQKRFLVRADIAKLKSYSLEIDNNLASGKIVLPDTGYEILNQRINQVQAMVDRMLGEHRISGLGSKEEQHRFHKGFVDYQIKSGETLFSVASKFTGVTVDDIKADNALVDPSKIEAGQVLKIRQFGSASPGLVVGNFTVTREEFYQSDPEKNDFAADLESLGDRWRQILKLQLVSQYLDLEEERDANLTAKEQDDKTVKSDRDLWLEAIEKVKKRNRSFFQRLRQETLQDHYDRFFNCVTRAFGPHTNYIPPAGKEQFDISMRGSLEGIGALLREDDGFIKVVRIIPGSASARQGMLEAEDIILEVAQEGEEPVDITEMRLRDAVRLIRGPKGEAVTLTVKKGDGTKKAITIVRDVVQIEETFVKSTVLDSENGGKIGYIFIPSFYRDFEGARNAGRARNSTDDTRAEIEKLKEKFVDGIILDLRDDGGGALVDAVDITGLFIEVGPVVQVKNSFGEKRVLSDKNGAIYYDGPLVVLVNKFSASASEIVAAALQDYKRAVIVGGTHTHGKGSVQTILDLNERIPLLHLKKYDDLGALKIMVQKFYRINGSSTQYKGVEPDIVLPNLLEHIKSGERYLDYSLPWDSIEAVPYSLWRSPFDLEKIKNRSRTRVAADKGLKIIEEEEQKAAARSKDTMVSLNLADMRGKREESEEMRQKVGEYYKRFRDESLVDELDGDLGDADEQNPPEEWLSEVNGDPYIREAINIVGDIIEYSR